MTDVGWIKKHVIAHPVAQSEFLYFLSPSLKFLSSHNSLRNFFSPSRGEIKILHLATSLPSCLAASDTDFASKSALLDSTPLSSSLPWRENELCPKKWTHKSRAGYIPRHYYLFCVFVVVGIGIPTYVLFKRITLREFKTILN